MRRNMEFGDFRCSAKFVTILQQFESAPVILSDISFADSRKRGRVGTAPSYLQMRVAMTALQAVSVDSRESMRSLTGSTIREFFLIYV